MEVSALEVGAQSDLGKLRYLGSPTVLLDGRDIDPAVRRSTAFGFT